MLVPRIISYCHIQKSAVILNGQSIFTDHTSDLATFLDNCYDFFPIQYPKFHKMDKLSKVAFLATEMLLTEFALSTVYEPDRIGIHFLNNHSSIDTDLNYQRLINKSTTSPSVFVYTLPNIMIGEICIKHNIKGENLLMISNTFETEFQVQEITDLFKLNLVHACIAGWVDVVDEKYEAFVYLVDNKISTEKNILFTPENLLKLYKLN